MKKDSFDRDSVLEVLASANDGGISMSRLAQAMGVGKSGRNELRRVVDDLVDVGLVDRVGRRYAIGDKLAAPESSGGGPQASGMIRVHPAGYGFVERDDGLGDVFVPAKYRGSAMDGDTVRLYTWEGYRGTEGRVEEVLARGRAKLTGVIERAGRHIYLEPDDPRISGDYGRISLVKGGPSAAVGKAVVIEIVEYPSEGRDQIVGRVSRVLGDPEDPNTEIEKILAISDIPIEFPEEVTEQARKTSQEVIDSDLADRIDLRDRPFVTIDPETARDFDDALCLEDGPHGGPRVWVAVADVSHYVQPGSPIDDEATLRGVSVYLPDRVVPMLPFELSSGICSLNPEVDRCAMVVRLDYDDDARLVDTGFAAAVIRSHARLDYPGVAGALAGDLRGRRARYRRWLPALQGLNRLAQKLRARRRARGTLELEISEAKVVLDADDPKLVRDVVRAKADPGEREAYELIEEFMIAANEAVGDYFARHRADTVWRVHAPPDPERLEELAPTMSAFGFELDIEEAQTPLGLQQLLADLRGHPVERALSFQVLRSLKQAVWDTENIGHFGLASKRYLHFTSPIRRYPDLLVHRLLKIHLHREGQASGLGAGAGEPPSEGELKAMAREASGHERRAVEAEREAVSMYRALLMRDQIGDELSGTISGVTSFGVFVEADEPFVEGLIKLEELGDEKFDFDQRRLVLAGRHSGLQLGLGDRVAVEVVDASIVRRKVALRLLEVEEHLDIRKKRGEGSGKKKGSKSGGKKSSKKGQTRGRGRGKDDKPGKSGKGRASSKRGKSRGGKSASNDAGKRKGGKKRR